MTVFNAVEILKSKGKIDHRLSPLDNAIAALESILPSALDEGVRASCVYALDVLRMDSVRMVVPTGLSLESAQPPPGDGDPAPRSDGEALEWLVQCFTPGARAAGTAKKRSFKSTAKSVCLAIRLLGRRGSNVAADDAAAGALDGADAAAVSAALAGVDEWGWDVWQLRAASGGRPLQALGWHLMRQWGLLDDLKLDGAVVRSSLYNIFGAFLRFRRRCATLLPPASAHAPGAAMAGTISCRPPPA